MAHIMRVAAVLRALRLKIVADEATLEALDHVGVGHFVLGDISLTGLADVHQGSFGITCIGKGMIGFR